MKSLVQKLGRACIVAGLCLVGSSVFAQDQAEGIVRISKRPGGQPEIMSVSYAQNCQSTQQQPCDGNGCHPRLFKGALAECYYGGSGGNGGFCNNGCYGNNGCFGNNGWGCGYGNQCGRHPNSQAMIDYFRCKFGYFIPTGGGGAGVPVVGCYSRVYPQNPYYFDQRDGQVWGAQGYGMPMSVPLPPTVGHAFNYGWGTPSARLTPISRPAY